MTLGQKIVVLFFALGASFSVVTYAAMHLTVFPTFSNFERENSESAVARVNQVLDANLRSLEIFNLVYSLWDQTYAYALGRIPDMLPKTLIRNIGIASTSI